MIPQSKKGVVGVAALLRKKFKKVEELAPEWVEHLGAVGVGANICIWGNSANGKTEYAIKLIKALAKAGLKCYYNSAEQGISDTTQAGAIRQDLTEVKGKIVFAKDSWEVMVNRLRKHRSYKVLVIDSREYFQLKAKTFIDLCDEFPNRIIIIICQGGAEPHGKAGVSIKFHCDVKIRVAGFVAYPSGRLGGFNEMVIWQEGIEIMRNRNRQFKALRTGEVLKKEN